MVSRPWTRSTKFAVSWSWEVSKLVVSPSKHTLQAQEPKSFQWLSTKHILHTWYNCTNTTVSYSSNEALKMRVANQRFVSPNYTYFLCTHTIVEELIVFSHKAFQKNTFSILTYVYSSSDHSLPSPSMSRLHTNWTPCDDPPIRAKKQNHMPPWNAFRGLTHLVHKEVRGNLIWCGLFVTLHPLPKWHAPLGQRPIFEGSNLFSLTSQTITSNCQTAHVLHYCLKVTCTQ